MPLAVITFKKRRDAEKFAKKFAMHVNSIEIGPGQINVQVVISDDKIHEGYTKINLT